MFRWFKFDWLKSEERKELEKLRKERKNQEERKQEIENLIEEMLKETKKPYEKIYFSGETIMVSFENGDIISSECNFDTYEKVKEATSREEIESIIFLKNKIEENENSNLVLNSIDVLKKNEDFEIKEGKIFLKPSKLPLVDSVIASFIEILERKELGQDVEEKYEALKNFWFWTSLNPIESSRNDLLNFVTKNEIAITKEGFLLMYRNVVSTGSSNKKLVKFISENFHKAKRNKKSPKNYEVYSKDDEFYLKRADASVSEEYSYLGNLNTLYFDLPKLEENTYTDSHTRTKVIKIGHVYKEDEDKVDLDNTKDCSSGLHVGSYSFLFSGFGDTGVIALVNPMFVRSVPISETNKMRVSEMFIVGTVSLEDYKEDCLRGEVLEYGEVYKNETFERVKEAVESKNFNQLCPTKNPITEYLSISEIREMIKNKVVSI